MDATGSNPRRDEKVVTCMKTTIPSSSAFSMTEAIRAKAVVRSRPSEEKADESRLYLPSRVNQVGDQVHTQQLHFERG